MRARARSHTIPSRRLIRTHSFGFGVCLSAVHANIFVCLAHETIYLLRLRGCFHLIFHIQFYRLSAFAECA